MYPDQEPNTLIIGTREALIGVFIFILLVGAIIVLIFMLGRDKPDEEVASGTPEDIANAVLFFFTWIAMENPSFDFILFGISVIFLYLVVRFVDIKKAFL